MMRFFGFVICLLSPLIALSQTPVEVKAEGLTGRLLRYESFSSQYVDPRNVDVWFPADYNPKKKYAVLYMHDGQNLFIPALSYTKIDWGVDEALTKLMRNKEVRRTIVVGIWNTAKRVPEYMPQKALKYATREQLEKAPAGLMESAASDNYLRFIVEELKPLIDKTYKTKTGRKETFIMGSSMGGLISCYAISEYPSVFGGAGCISTHFPAGDGIVIDYFAENLPKPGKNRFYFDYGTETLDAQYEPYQTRMDEVMRNKGFRNGKDWITRKFEGADHSEKSWKARIDIPLVFLLGK